MTSILMGSAEFAALAFEPVRGDAQVQVHDQFGKLRVARADCRGKVTVMLETLQFVLPGAYEMRTNHDWHVDDA